MSKSKIEVVGRGIYGNDGEIAIGTEIEISGDVPDGWKDKVRVIAVRDADDAELITNDEGLRAVHHARGKYKILDGDRVVISEVSKEDAVAFNELSDEDKAAYVAQG